MGHKWMCDVIGTQPASEDKLREVIEGGITTDNIEDFIGNRGNLPTNVKEHIKTLGYEWTDSGGGVNNWHIGVPFNDLFTAITYLHQMTTKFRVAIAAGFLKFKLMSWSKEAWDTPRPADRGDKEGV